MSALVFAMRPKQAAIYYDEVLPAGFGIESLQSKSAQDVFEGMLSSSPEDKIKFLDDALSLGEFDKTFEDLLPLGLSNCKDDLRKLIVASSTLFLARAAIGLRGDENLTVKTEKIKSLDLDEEHIKFINSLERAFNNHLGDIFNYVPNNVVYDIIMGDQSSDESAHLVLAATPLVDVSSATWEQILSFRKDKKSRIKLLRFREFFYKNIKSKSVAEAQEKLELLKLEYDDAAKKHGFELTYQSLSSVLNMRTFGSGGLMGFVATQAGLGPLSLAVAAAPIVWELGVFGFHLYGAKHSVAEFQAANPISYLSEVESRLLPK